MSHPPALFLDVDGVLNSAAFMKATPGAFDGSDWIHMLDPVPCARLARLCAATGAVIVLSSSWRVQFDPAGMEALLRRRDVPVRVIDTTSMPGTWRHKVSGLAWLPGPWPERGDEIRKWLREHPEVTRWAVVDDCCDMDAVCERFVQTTWANGLQDEHVERLVALLSEDA